MPEICAMVSNGHPAVSRSVFVLWRNAYTVASPGDFAAATAVAIEKGRRSFPSLVAATFE